MQTIREIYFVNWLGNSPACVDRESGDIYINEELWKNIPLAHRLFILLHEWGHVALNTKDELEVDEFAHDLYMALGYSLKESVKALTRQLHYSNAQHLDRTQKQLSRAEEFDYFQNCNYKIGRI